MNSTRSMLKFVTTAPYVRPFSDAAATVATVFILTMMVFGILANFATMIVILKSKQLLQSTFNFVIVSLCASDMLSALISPLFLYRRTWGFDEWLIPEFLCKTYAAVDTWTNYVTSFHILLFAVIRLVSIKWPLRYHKLNSSAAKIIIAGIWLVTFCCGFIPRWLFYSAKPKDRSVLSVDSKWPVCTIDAEWLVPYRVYYKIAFPVFIYFPMLMIVILSPVMSIILIKQRNARQQLMEGNNATSKNNRNLTQCEKRTRRRENFAMLQLGFITGTFMFGYIPTTSYTIYSTNITIPSLAGKIVDWHFATVAYIFLRFSECMNPIFYNVASGKMRKETIAFLKSLSVHFSSSGSTLRTSAASDTPLPMRKEMTLEL